VDTRDVVGRLNRAFEDRGPDIDDHYIEKGHGENVFDFTTNVPFVLAGPGIEPASVDAQVRQVDVLPTILERFGLSVDADGEPIRPGEGVEDRPAYMRACGASLHREQNWGRAIRADGAKYVEYPDRDWEPELYDLGSDPGNSAASRTRSSRRGSSGSCPSAASHWTKPNGWTSTTTLRTSATSEHSRPTAVRSL